MKDWRAAMFWGFIGTNLFSISATVVVFVLLNRVNILSRDQVEAVSDMFSTQQLHRFFLEGDAAQRGLIGAIHLMLKVWFSTAVLNVGFATGYYFLVRPPSQQSVD